MSEEAKQIHTAINQMAAMRLSQRFGPHILELFLSMENAMRQSGGTSFTGNITFMVPGDEVRQGELLPTMHFSLQPHFPILSVPIEIEDESGDDDVQPDSSVRDGTDQ